MSKHLTWTKIEDFRDPAYKSTRYELVVPADFGDVLESELPALPDGCDHAWQHGTRWLCD